MPKGNLPIQQINKSQAKGKNAEIMTKLTSVFSLPELETHTPEAVQQRITDYFTICSSNDMRPGVEGMCLALGINRSTLYRWETGQMSKELQTIAVKAKQVIAAYIENISLNGQLNPATSCFLLKNWFGYKDVVTNEVEVKPSPFGETLSNEQINNLIED